MNSKTPRLTNWSIRDDKAGEYVTKDIIVNAIFNRTGRIPKQKNEHYLLVGNRTVEGEDPSIIISPGLLRVERIGEDEIVLTTNRYHEFILNFKDAEKDWLKIIHH